jgi:hypothetical protein
MILVPLQKPFWLTLLQNCGDNAHFSYISILQQVPASGDFSNLIHK